MERDAQVAEVEKAYPGPKDFVHLHVHTVFSPLDGIPEPAEYVDACGRFGFPALAVTDHNTMAGIPDAYFAAKKADLKFIPGCEVYYNDNHPAFKQKNEVEGKSVREIVSEIFQQKYGREPGPKDKDLFAKENEAFRREHTRNRHVTVLAKDQVGYRNLINILTTGWAIGHYYRPKTWLAEMEKRKEGLIVLSGCLNSPVNFFLAAKDGIKEAVAYVRRFRAVFGDDYFIEVQMPGPNIPGAVQVFVLSMQLAKALKIKAVLTGDVHYLKREDFMVQKLLMAIDQKLKVDDPGLFHVDSDEQFLKTRAEYRQTFLTQGYAQNGVILADLEAACDNTVEVAARCEGFKPDTSLKLPVVPDADRQLVALALAGLQRIGKHGDGAYAARMKYELGMIIEKKFSSYFLITLDLINHSRSLGYEVGPGRGSVGGSLVAYLIGITSIDPIRHGLKFERFISPSRGGNLLKVTMQ
jgi:DNA polymerase-3 subunit alpha